MGRKTPISFDLRKCVEKHSLQRSVVNAQQNKKTRRAATHTTFFLI